MGGFRYNNSDTTRILEDAELIVCFNSAVDTVAGVSRQTEGGDPTISSSVVNEYGTVADKLVFEFALAKKDMSDFSYDEQRHVERWLTSPKFSMPIQFFGCGHDDTYKYYGKFTQTEWSVSDDGFYSVACTFEVNGNYAYEEYNRGFSSPSRTADSWSIILYDESDELEEWVYPVVTISPNGDNASCSMTFISDDNHQMTINTEINDTLTFDCKRCTVSRGNGRKVYYSQIGWADIENIYWPRLRPGENQISVTGNVNLNFKYEAPVKIVGGWLA